MIPPRRLLLGKFKGSSTLGNFYKIRPEQSLLQHFAYRYYPRERNPGHAGGTSPVIRLRERLTISFMVPIAKTSKSSVIRRRLCHRIASAFRLELLELGADAVPKSPMNLIFSPRMTVLQAPFLELREDVGKTYVKAMQTHPGKGLYSSSTPSSGRPELRGDKYSMQENISATIRALPWSAYTKSHGGPVVLLEKLRNSVKHHMKPSS